MENHYKSWKRVLDKDEQDHWKTNAGAGKQSYKDEQNHWKSIARVGNNPMKINEIIGKPL